jgi:pSer/pThr/pTyr-binding forkhead associated (FHA) protein
MEDEIKLQENQNKAIPFEIGYIVPFWSSKPLHKYSLDVWRDGIIQDTIDISQKEYYLIGRNKDISDIYINNMTVSRAHCVIQHKDDGEIFLYDLDSGYGTHVNQKKIATKAYVKLNVGDTFKIGLSSQMFILNGPSTLLPDEEDIPMRQEAGFNKKELLEKRINQIKTQYNERENYKRTLLDPGVATWGQVDVDDEIMNEQNDEDIDNKDNNPGGGLEDYYGITDLEEIKNRKNLTEKQKNMLDKIDNFKKGIQKLKDEMIKIKKKEEDTGDLTDGQRKRLQICETKINELNDKLEVQEDNLRISLSSKEGFGGTEVKFDKNYLKELNSDEDDFYDRSKFVKSNKQTTSNTEVVTENYETLKAKLENLIRNRQRLVDKLQKVDQAEEGGDEQIHPLEQYIKETENKMLSDGRKSMTQQITDISKEITKTQKLLSLVTPSHIKIKYKSNEEGGGGYKPEPAVVAPKTNVDDSKKKKKVTSVADTLAQFSKFKQKKINEQKYADSDEEIIDEIQQYRDNLAINDPDFLQKKEEFRKALLRAQNEVEEVENTGGLIKSSTTKNYFEEIVNNIGEEYDPQKYSGIKSVIEAKNKKGRDTGIDYSAGGLQTFSANPQGDSYLQRKRDRPEKENQKIVYGPSMNPEDTNREGVIDEDYDDFDPTVRFKKAHDISGSNRYQDNDLNNN